MLRNKKYNKKKKQGLNDFFKKEYDSEDVIYSELNNVIIKENINFNIIKEELLGTYILAFKNIIILHLDELEYNDFVYLYKNSNEYLFDVYTTINYKDKITLGIVYCYLKKMNIDFYIDKIDVINKTEPETKSNSKPKSKTKSKSNPKSRQNQVQSKIQARF